MDLLLLFLMRSIMETRDRVASVEGCFLCPEGAATMSAYEQAMSFKINYTQ